MAAKKAAKKKVAKPKSDKALKAEKTRKRREALKKDISENIFAGKDAEYLKEVRQVLGSVIRDMGKQTERKEIVMHYDWCIKNKISTGKPSKAKVNRARKALGLELLK